MHSVLDFFIYGLGSWKNLYYKMNCYLDNFLLHLTKIFMNYYSLSFSNIFDGNLKKIFWISKISYRRIQNLIVIFFFYC